MQHDEAIAACTQLQARALIRFDHHRVLVEGRSGVMLTYDWPDPDTSEGPFVLRVIFAHADQHPPAPEAIQRVVDGLTWTW